MSTVTDAVFFIKDGQIVQEMMKAEFDALVDGIVDLPDYKGRKMAAVYLQITDSLAIRSLLFFIISFDQQGRVAADWNVPINQLMQSAGRGMDLGAGLIRLVTKSQCSVPWHKESLWDPTKAVYSALVQSVKENRLGIVESEESWQAGDEWDIPVLTAEPPVLTAVPTLTAAEIPVLQTAQSSAAVPSPTEETTAAEQANDENLNALRQELNAMKAAYSVRIDKLQKERDELKEKVRTISESLKEQAKEHISALNVDFNHDLQQKESQIQALKERLENEQKRYTELKEQQAEQATQYQIEREEMEEKLQQDKAASKEVDGLKLAFSKELAAKVEAETTQMNARLAMREVELFYREEQMNLLHDEIAQLKSDKQQLLNSKDGDVLRALEDQGVSLVMFQAGLGHITLGFDDIGKFLAAPMDYLASRYGVSEDDFIRWQKHYQQPVCQHVEQGNLCNKTIKRVEMLAHFVAGVSDRCDQHTQK